MGSGAWQATVHRITESDMTEQLTLSLALLLCVANTFHSVYGDQ